MPSGRYTQHVKILLPMETGRLLEEMAKARDMSLNTLVSELVHLGIISLNYPSPGPFETLRAVDPNNGEYGGPQ